MRLFQKLFNTKKSDLMFISMTVLIAILAPETSTASQKTANNTIPKLLVLDNCDKDNNLETPPFGDTVLLLNSKGELNKHIYRLRINYVRGALSISDDGHFFVVCENALNRLTMYKTATARQFWSLSGLFSSAAISKKVVYAINIQNVYAIDDTGTIIKHARSGGLDIAVDKSHNCLWIVGNDIKKYSLDLQLEFKMPLTQSAVNAGAFSVDVCPDGSVWVAERGAHTINGGRNKLVKISPDGRILKTIDLDFSPSCVRVDQSGNGIWTTGFGKRDFSKIGYEWPETLNDLYELAPIKKYTHKYDLEGKFLFNLTHGGYSIDLDPSDGSIWMANEKSIRHYSSTGEKLAEYNDVSDGQKWLAVIPAKKTGS